MGQKIAFFDAKSYDKQFFNQFNKEYGFDIDYLDHRLSEKTVHLAKGAEVICVFVEDDVGKELIDQLVSLNVKLIALRSAGYNNVDLEYAKGKIQVVRVPSYSPSSVAEHAMGLILSLNRKTHMSYYRSRIGDFKLDGMIGFDLKGKTIGIVGTGKIGKEMIGIANGFKMNVIASDSKPLDSVAKELNFEYVSFETLLSRSDIISLHCPLTEENTHLINQNTIEKMKDNVMIINTGRGKLVNTKDLIEGLKSKKIYAAGIDVYEEENQYFFHDYSTSIIQDDVLARLIFFPNVLVTSHQGFFTEEALENIAKTTLESISQFVSQKPLTNEVVFQKRI
ncbi:MAG TPA: 2-hydroxyacid dehydrogenase [Chlamydiales bacterium]|nr:2-hydroxyacid dehydrogenase [Chlamydiales bacterium]